MLAAAHTRTNTSILTTYGTKTSNTSLTTKEIFRLPATAAATVKTAMTEASTIHVKAKGLQSTNIVKQFIKALSPVICSTTITAVVKPSKAPFRL